MTKTSTTRIKQDPAKGDKSQARIRRNYIIYGIGAGAVLGGGYLLFNYLQDRKILERGQSLVVNNILPAVPATGRPAPRSAGGFPLKKGARGELVRQLQTGLLRRGGQAAALIRSTSIRPDGTPDGVFGNGTEQALRAAGLPTTVSEQLFTQITGAVAKSSKVLADELIKAANSKNLFAVLAVLKQLQNSNDYVSVRSHFKNVRVGGVKVTTPVNALLSVVFKNNEPAKVKIRAEFRRMGLKQNANGTWALSGLGTLNAIIDSPSYIQDSRALDVVITERPTLLRSKAGDYLLPALAPNTVIGYLTDQHRGVSQILTENGVTVYAPSQNLTLL